jgi:prevent-host-death family protein
MAMHEVGAFEAKNKLGTLLDWVEGGEEVLITRHGKAVARLVPAVVGFDRAKAKLAAQRIRERAKKVAGSFDWAEWKAYRDEGRP